MGQSESPRTFRQNIFDVDGAEAAGWIVSRRDAKAQTVLTLDELQVEFLANLARADGHESAGGPSSAGHVRAQTRRLAGGRDGGHSGRGRRLALTTEHHLILLLLLGCR